MRASAFGWLPRKVFSSGSSTAGEALPLVPPRRARGARTRAGELADPGGTGGAGGDGGAGVAGRGGADGRDGVAVVTGSSTATGTTSSATWLSPDVRPGIEHNGREAPYLPARRGQNVNSVCTSTSAWANRSRPPRKVSSSSTLPPASAPAGRG